MVVVNPAGAGVGSLLRKAEEQNQQNVLLNKPSAQVASPLRNLVRSTMLTPLSPGTSRIVGQAGEQVVPTEAMTPGVAPGMAGGTNAMPVMMSTPGSGVMPMGQTSAPNGSNAGPSSIPSSRNGAAPTMSTPRATSQSILGASTAAPSRVGSYQANPVPQVNAKVTAGQSSFPSNQAWQSAQTPAQHIIGGLAKRATEFTSSLNLPQLVPGGIFKQIQSKMAPIVNKLLPNFNWNRG